MDFFITERHEKFYNCSFYSVEDIPLERRQHKLVAVIFLVHYVVYEILYIPCLFSLWKHLEQSCYKFMFAIGVIDVIALNFAALVPGIFGFTGTVFCSSPLLVYITGNFTAAVWISESSFDILLAMNRCIETISPRLGKTLYKGWRTWLWLTPVALYLLYVLTFEKITVYTGVYFTYIPNPHAGYHDELTPNYSSVQHIIHNIAIVIAMVCAYTTYLIVFFLKFCRHLPSSSIASSKRMFLQVIVISSLNCIFSLLAIYMEFVYANQLMTYIALYIWVNVHGSTCLVYLFLNKTIRTDCKEMVWEVLEKLKILKVPNATIGPSTIGPSTVNSTLHRKISTISDRAMPAIS